MCGSPHTPVPPYRYTFPAFFLTSPESVYDQSVSEHDSKSTYFLALVKTNRVKTCLRQDASDRTPRAGPSGGTPSPAGGGGGLGFRRDRFRLRGNSAPVGSSVLASDAASAYILYWLALSGPSHTKICLIIIPNTIRGIVGYIFWGSIVCSDYCFIVWPPAVVLLIV